jgi:hypothetical protein
MTSIIILEELSSISLDPENSVHLIIIHDDDSEFHEIIDTDIDIKRYRDDLTENTHRVRSRTNDIPFISQSINQSISQPPHPIPTSIQSTSIPSIPLPRQE